MKATEFVAYKCVKTEVQNMEHSTVTFSLFLLQNTEILRALQKASGLSPDDEPIKLLSVPKGALGNDYQN